MRDRLWAKFKTLWRWGEHYNTLRDWWFHLPEDVRKKALKLVWGVALMISGLFTTWQANVQTTLNENWQFAIVFVLTIVATAGVLYFLTKKLNPTRPEKKAAPKPVTENIYAREPQLAICSEPLRHSLPEKGPRHPLGYAYKIKVTNKSHTDAIRPTANLLAIGPAIKYEDFEADGRVHSFVDEFDLTSFPTPTFLHWSGQGSNAELSPISPGGEATFGLCYYNEIEHDRPVTLAIHTSDQIRLGYHLPADPVLYVFAVSSSGCRPTYGVFEVWPDAPIVECDFKKRYIGPDRPDLATFQEVREIAGPNSPTPDIEADSPPTTQ